MRGKFLIIDQLKTTIEISSDDIEDYLKTLIIRTVNENGAKKHKTQFLLFEDIKRFLKEGRHGEV